MSPRTLATIVAALAVAVGVAWLAVRPNVEDGQIARVDLGGAARGNHVVSGTVRAGSPVPGARVTFLSDETLDEPWPEATTDHAGRYEIALPRPGPYSASASVEGFAVVHHDVDVPNAPAAVIDLEFGTGRIAGTVLGPDGQECGGVSVLLNSPLEPGRSEGFCRPRTGGRFAFDGVVPGTYELRTHGAEELAPGLVRGLRVDAGTELEGIVVQLQAGAKLDVRVLHPDGRPADGARVLWRLSADQHGFAMEPADAAGVVGLTGLPAGTLRLAATAEFEIGTATATVRAGESSAMTLSLAPAGRIAVVILGRDGAVVPDAGVHDPRVTDARGGETDWMDHRDEGVLAYEVSPGRYEVRARFGAREIVQEIDVRAGNEHRVVLQEPE